MTNTIDLSAARTAHDDLVAEIRGLQRQARDAGQPLPGRGVLAERTGASPYRVRMALAELAVHDRNATGAVSTGVWRPADARMAHPQSPLRELGASTGPRPDQPGASQRQHPPRRRGGGLPDAIDDEAESGADGASSNSLATHTGNPETAGARHVHAGAKHPTAETGAGCGLANAGLAALAGESTSAAAGASIVQMAGASQPPGARLASPIPTSSELAPDGSVALAPAVGARVVSWAGFVFGTVMSVAANVLHTWLPAQHPGSRPLLHRQVLGDVAAPPSVGAALPAGRADRGRPAPARQARSVGLDDAGRPDRPRAVL